LYVCIAFLVMDEQGYLLVLLL